MADVNTDIIISFSYGTQSAFDTLPTANKVPLLLLGQAPNATAEFPENKLIKVTSPIDAEKYFGTNLTGNDFVEPVEILHNSGCQQIYLVRVIIPDEATPENKRAIIIGGDNPKSGLHLLKSVYTYAGQKAIAFAICIPGIDKENDIIADAIKVAEEAGSQFVINFEESTSVADAVAVRGTTLALGTKSLRFIVCYGHIKEEKDPAQIDPLSYHLMAAMASTFQENPAKSPGGVTLKNASEIVETMNLSTTDPNSDNEKLNDVGVVCPNIISIPGIDATGSVKVKPKIVTWGVRNAGYPTDKTQFSYLQALPFRDMIASVLQTISAFYLHRPCDLSNAKALETACRNALSAWGVKVMFLKEESDFEQKTLKYLVEYSIGFVTERIHYDVRLTAKEA